MKDIAENRHTGLGRTRLTITVFAFSIVVASLGLNFINTLDEYWKGIITGNPELEALVSTGSLSILWALLVFIFAFLLEKISIIQAIFGWPHYFLYTFKFSAQEPIVGWTRINLDSSGILQSEGYSFNASPDRGLDINSLVTWDSQTVSAGMFKSRPSCYMLYKLNERQAASQNRSYRNGLLRFQVIERRILIDQNNWPGEKETHQYFGCQQAIEKDGVWNFAYAERYYPRISIRNILLQALSVIIGTAALKDIHKKYDKELMVTVEGRCKNLLELHDTFKTNIDSKYQ
jgi:hypothetical protein